MYLIFNAKQKREKKTNKLHNKPLIGKGSNMGYGAIWLPCAVLLPSALLGESSGSAEQDLVYSASHSYTECWNFL